MTDSDIELLERTDKKAPESKSGDKLMAKKARQNKRGSASKQMPRTQEKNAASESPPHQRLDGETPKPASSLGVSPHQEGTLSATWATAIIPAVLALLAAIFGIYQISSSQSEKLTNLINQISEKQIKSYGELNQRISDSNNKQSEKLIKLISGISETQIANYGELNKLIAVNNNELGNMKTSIDLLRQEQNGSLTKTNVLLTEAIEEIKGLSKAVIKAD